MKMLNNCIACINLDETIAKQGEFVVASKNNKYKKLKVEVLPHSAGDYEGLVKGAEIYVLATAGVEIPIGDVKYTVVKLQDILLIN